MFSTAGQWPLYISAAAGALLALPGLYFAVVSLLGLLPNNTAKQRRNSDDCTRAAQGAAALAGPSPATDSARFAVLVAARNEEGVIGQLVDSLYAQNYPGDRYEVLVAPNNCTDATAEVAAGHGASIFHVQTPVRSKGEVLRQMCDYVLAFGRFDAVCIFDADNLVHPDFLQKMNDAYTAGANAAQSFRDTKNPAASAVATCHALGFWLASRFYNAGHSAMGLSALMSGCGIMVSTRLLRQLGGWNTSTITEDYEFTAQAALAGERVWYVPKAIIYDEQPLTLAQSWRQRRRWESGHTQGMHKYFSALMQKGTRRQNAVCLDLALMFATPATMYLSLVNTGVQMAASLYNLPATGLDPMGLLFSGALALGALYAVITAAAAFVAFLHMGKRACTAWRGILAFAPFLLTCVPVTLLSLFHQEKHWKPIVHTCTVSIGDLAA